MRPTMRPIFSFSLLYACGVWNGTSKLPCPGSLPVIYTNLGAIMVQTLGPLQTLLSRVLLTWNKRFGSQRLLSTGKVCGRGSITQSTLKIGSPAWLRHMKVILEIPIWKSLILLFGQGVLHGWAKQPKSDCHVLFFSKPGSGKWPLWSLFQWATELLEIWSYSYIYIMCSSSCFFGISH